MSDALLPADWPAPGPIRAFTTMRCGAGVSVAPFDRFNLGARCGDAPEAVARNRAELVRIGGLPSAPYWLRQVHGTQVVGVGRTLPLPQAGEGLEPEADAAVTDEARSVLAILTADCLPVLFSAVDGGEVGAAHAGWRGLAAGVLEATVAAMRTPPDRLLAWLGPAAGPQHYEVGDEVRDAFVSHDPTAGAAFVSTRPQHWRVDLYALAHRRLIAAGLAAEQIHGGGLCTIGDAQRFYSHRRDQRTGRMASLIWIEPSR
ncbi:MAG: peptidoglycan editing factor PgeF [Proteobacteria bacterium]|nr:peptidoglycan editing factor PgeF [Pseudomonadota bacterium]